MVRNVVLLQLAFPRFKFVHQVVVEITVMCFGCGGV